MKPFLVILTDSLGLPRLDPARVELEQTWPQLLRAALPGVAIHQVSVGTSTGDDLLTQLSYVEGFGPSLTIVQAGIVDCAPRAFGRTELALLKSFAPGRLLLSFLRPGMIHWLRRTRHLSYASPEEFAKTVARTRKATDGRILWLQILGSSTYEDKVPGISRSISRFNAILQDQLGNGFVNLDCVGDAELATDGHHLNVAGHRKVFDTVMKRVNDTWPVSVQRVVTEMQ